MWGGINEFQCWKAKYLSGIQRGLWILMSPFTPSQFLEITLALFHFFSLSTSTLFPPYFLDFHNGFPEISFFILHCNILKGFFNFLAQGPVLSVLGFLLPTSVNIHFKQNNGKCKHCLWNYIIITVTKIRNIHILLIR